MVTEQIANLSTGNRRPGSSPGLSAFAPEIGAPADTSAVFVSRFQTTLKVAWVGIWDLISSFLPLAE